MAGQCTRIHRRSLRGRIMRRRGVSSVLAMMFLVIFGSLAIAMAVVAQGNLRTADSSLKVSRAMSAADTGIVFAARMLSEQGARFVVEKGVVDPDYAENLWLGTYDEGADGAVTVLPPTGYIENTTPDGVIDALANVHAASAHSLVIAGDVTVPTIDAAFGTLRVPPIAMDSDAGGNPTANGPYFRLKYELLASADDDDPDIRVTSQGVDGDITRTLKMDFHIEKKIEFAVISPNRIMIGKNVRIEGPLGSRYGIVAGELDTANGDPLVMRSDFYYLNAALDTNLDLLHQQIVSYDADGDGRLRPDHPTEADGLSGYAVLADVDGDQYVTDFDLFLGQFDANGDKKVCYSPAMAGAAGLGALGNEFDDIDDQLARLIDEAFADRNEDDVVTFEDTQLGYKDGVIDAKDYYAKVTGRLAFAVARNAWDTANGASYQTIVNGPVRPKTEQAAVKFEVTDEELLEITTDMFLDSHTWFDAAAAGQAFDSASFDGTAGQVAAGIAAGGTFTPPDATTWEDVPYGATSAGGGAYDWYQRRVYRDMTFTNVRIPAGCNAVFYRCTFVGATYIEAEEDCLDPNWNYSGSKKRIEDTGNPGTYIYQPGDWDIPSTLDGNPVTDTRPLSNNLRFHDCFVLGSISGTTPGQYTHWRNKLQFTGSTRFYINPDDPDIATDNDAGTAATIVANLQSISNGDREEMKKSSILMAGWSIDVGSFSNEAPKVKLSGTIIAGILDVRGTVDVHGTLLMTFRPIAGEGPLFYGGQNDAFNTTIGYFGPADGDSEGVDPDDAGFDGFGEITLRYDPDAKLPDGIPWPIRIKSEPSTYVEGGSL